MGGNTAGGSPGASVLGRPPRVFLSYAHDDAEFSDLVRRFYEFLRVDCGIDAVFDRVAAQTPQDWTAWMIRQIDEADFILSVASPQYRAAADAALTPDVRRGAQWETRHLRDLFNANVNLARARVVPVILPGGAVEDIPTWMAPPGYPHYRVNDFSRQGAEALLRYLTSQPSYVEPPLGPLSPDSFLATEVFIVCADADCPTAEKVYASLNEREIATILESKSIELGEDRDLRIQRAQREARLTVVVISRNTQQSFLTRDSVATGLAMAAKDPERHRVVPFYLDDSQEDFDRVPYGLRIKQGVRLNDSTTVETLSEQLVELVTILRQRVELVHAHDAEDAGDAIHLSDQFSVLQAGLEKLALLRKLGLIDEDVHKQRQDRVLDDFRGVLFGNNEEKAR